MTQNRELAVIAMSKALGRAEALGFDKSVEHGVRHRFFSPSGELSDLARHLRSNGFSVFENEDSPAIEALRCERIDFGSLEKLVRQMCDLAERFAAEYDGLTLDH